MSGCDFAHARDESEALYFAHVRRRGPYYLGLLVLRKLEDLLRKMYVS